MYLSEYANQRIRKIVKPVLEVLAGIPTVVYGFFALSASRRCCGPSSIRTDLQHAVAGIVMGFMIVPTVASLSEDAMSAVPHGLRQGAFALGTRTGG